MPTPPDTPTKLAPRDRVGLWLGAGLGVLLVLWLSGPRPRVVPPPAGDPLPSGLEGEALELYVAETESAHALRPDVEKQIVWADPETKAKTPLAIVYVHGFSATRQETAPLADTVAARLGANLFYTRLAGHGDSDEAFGEATAGDWLADTAEAYHIGARLGERVVVIGTSTGGTLATWLGAHPERFPQLAALVLMSPNYGVREASSRVLTWPWGGQIATTIAGDTRSWEPASDEQARFWHTTYPTNSLLPMMALVRYVNALDESTIKAPTLMIYSEGDEVVDTQFARARVESFASAEKEFVTVSETESPSQHVLAGRIVAPSGTEPLAEEIAAFIERLSAP